MFGKHPQVGISSLSINQSLIDNLVTEIDVSHRLGLLPDVPLEDATLIVSLGVDITCENPLDMLISEPSQKSDNEFHSVGFRTEKTDYSVTALIRKKKVHHEKECYFGQKGLSFQCGVNYESVPSHIT